MVFVALKDAQLNTLNRPKSAGARLGGRRGVIWNVLGVWGPSGGEAQRYCHPHKLRTKNANVSISRCDSRRRSLGGLAEPSREA